MIFSPQKKTHWICDKNLAKVTKCVCNVCLCVPLCVQMNKWITHKSLHLQKPMSKTWSPCLGFFLLKWVGILDCETHHWTRKNWWQSKPIYVQCTWPGGPPKFLQGRWGSFLSQFSSCTNFWTCQHSLGIGVFFLAPGWYWGFRVFFLTKNFRCFIIG